VKGEWGKGKKKFRRLGFLIILFPYGFLVDYLLYYGQMNIPNGFSMMVDLFMDCRED
jgi:hypothetical protein